MKSRKGFILIDSLLTVFLVSAVSILSLWAYESYAEYKKAVKDFETRENIKLEKDMSINCHCEVSHEYQISD